MPKIHDLFENAENAKSAENPEKMLTDEDLEAGGLQQVRAFVRTKASKNALRVAKAKAKKEKIGIKQLNIQAHESAHEVLRELAKATASGSSIEQAISAVTQAQALTAQQKKALEVMAQKSWKSWIIRKLCK